MMMSRQEKMFETKTPWDVSLGLAHNYIAKVISPGCLNPESGEHEDNMRVGLRPHPTRQEVSARNRYLWFFFHTDQLASNLQYFVEHNGFIVSPEDISL
jgi:hypothetical protein